MKNFQNKGDTENPVTNINYLNIEKSLTVLNGIISFFLIFYAPKIIYAQVSNSMVDTLPVNINSNSILIQAKPGVLVHFNNKNYIEVINSEFDNVKKVTLPDSFISANLYLKDIKVVVNELYLKNNKNTIIKTDINFTKKWKNVSYWPEEDLYKIFLKNGLIYLQSIATNNLTKINGDLNFFTILNDKLEHISSARPAAINEPKISPALNFQKDSIYYLDAHSFQTLSNIVLFKLGLCANCNYIINNGTFVNEYYLGRINSAIVLDTNLYILDNGNYIKLNLNTVKVTSINLSLPTNTNNFANSSTGYYFFGKNSFHINVQHGDVQKSDKYMFDQYIKGIFADDLNFYILTENSLLKIKRKSFDQSLSNYNADQFVADLDNFNLNVNSLTSDTSYNFGSYYSTKMQIDNSYANLITQTKSTEHFRICNTCTSSILFMNDLKEYLFNNEVDPRFIDANYYLVTRDLIERGQLKELISLDQYLKTKYNNRLHIDDQVRINSTLDSVRVYLELEKELEKNIVDKDSLELEKILKLDIIYYSSMFCHEGCGGCETREILNKLKKYYYSHRKYKDKLEYYFLTFENYSFEGSYTEKDRKAFENFLKRWPNSIYYPIIAHQLIDYHQSMLDLDAENEENKAEIIKFCKLIKDKYPDYFQKNNLDYWLMQYDNH